MPYYERQIRAGQCLEVETYEAAKGAGGTARSRNCAPTPEAQKKRNERRARQQLARTINANFQPGDLYVTLTFDDCHLPNSRKQAEREADNFIRRVRYHMGRDAHRLRHVCKLAQGNRSGRWHIHIVMNLRDANVVRALWGRGSVKVSWLDNHRDYTGLANYLFNQRDAECTGKRWKQSNHMRRPSVKKTQIKGKNRRFSGEKRAILRGYSLQEERGPDAVSEYWYARYLRIDTPHKRNVATKHSVHRAASTA